MQASAQAPARVLVVDDEDNLTFLITSALQLAGYETRAAATGSEALDEFAKFSPQVVVLDVMLPDFDGFEVLRRIRTTDTEVPVLFVTAKDATADRVHGLSSGADDYIVKPFALEELVARVNVAMRRLGQLDDSNRLAVADLEIDLDSRRVWRGGEEIHLSATEFDLLRVLMANAGRVVTRNQILDSVWRYDFGGETTIIESFISNLRKKVDTGEPKLIHTIRSVGYSIRES